MGDFGQEYLAGGEGWVVFHYLLKYAPETNPIERVWWHMHETLTPNHRCPSIDELRAQVYEWTERQRNFAEQTAYFSELYPLAAERYAPAEDLFEHPFF
jgi:transposase